MLVGVPIKTEKHAVVLWPFMFPCIWPAELINHRLERPSDDMRFA